MRLLTTALLVLSSHVVQAANLRESFESERLLALNETTSSAYFAKNKGWTAKDGYSLAFPICSGVSDSCERDQAEILVNAKFSYRGDYQAQRNLAYCLNTGCSNAIIMNKPLSCAWRIIILAAASHEVDDSDTSNLEFCLEKLSPIERATATSRSAAIFKTVYGRTIGREWR